LPGSVGAHHSPAAGQHQRLDDYGKLDTSCEVTRFIQPRRNDERGHGESGVAQPLSRQPLVARRPCSVRRVAGQPKQLRSIGGGNCRTIAYGNNPVDLRFLCLGHDRFHRRRLLVKAHRDRAIPPGILELIATVGREDQLDA
jgi:hypothetical protein